MKSPRNLDEKGALQCLKKALALRSVEQPSTPESPVQPLDDKALRMITDSVPIRIAVIDCDQRYLFSNYAHRQSWAGDGNGILGHTMKEILGDENYLSAQPYVERALLGEEVSFEMTVSYTTTEPRFVRVHYIPQFDAESNVTGCLILALDITEKRLSEEALRQSEARFGRLIQYTPVIPWELDVKSQLFTYVGHRAEEILGFPMSEWMKPRFRSKHLHPEDVRRVNDEFEQVIKEGEELETEYRLLHKDGSVVWLRDLVSVIRKNGEAIALQGLLIDITLAKEADIQRRKLEDKLREFQKMQALGTLAGGIAHDFNNILGGIIGYTELALSTAHNPKQSRSYIERIRDSSYRARDLVKQILSFSKGSKVEREDLILNSIVKEVLQLLRATIPTNIQINVDERVQGLLTTANATQIHQVILNICTNAAHAMKESGGTLRIRLDKISSDQVIERQIPELSIEDYALITIQDDGHGMSSEIMARIFEPYFTTKAAGEGTGLGLAVAHGIIANHGGTISVESELGKGSTFEVFLPLQSSALIADPGVQFISDELAQSIHGNGRILFVDDESSLVDIGRDMLQHIGYEVIGFSNSKEALEYFSEHYSDIDLLITDQTMPEMNGDMLIRKIREVRPDLPVILCTGYSALIDKKGAERLGVNTFLQKPYSILDLCNSVKGLLDKSVQ